MKKVLGRELFRIFLIVGFPIMLPMWMLSYCNKGERKGAFIFYWQSVFRKDLNLDYYKE